MKNDFHQNGSPTTNALQPLSPWDVMAFLALGIFSGELYATAVKHMDASTKDRITGYIKEATGHEKVYVPVFSTAEEGASSKSQTNFVIGAQGQKLTQDDLSRLEQMKQILTERGYAFKVKNSSLGILVLRVYDNDKVGIYLAALAPNFSNFLNAVNLELSGGNNSGPQQQGGTKPEDRHP